ncbi:hypothetical protein ACOME3_000858 [Neoechinorhynchus agilis]
MNYPHALTGTPTVLRIVPRSQPPVQPSPIMVIDSQPSRKREAIDSIQSDQPLKLVKIETIRPMRPPTPPIFDGNLLVVGRNGKRSKAEIDEICPANKRSKL